MSIKRPFDAVERRGDIGRRIAAFVLPISNRPRVTPSCAGKLGLCEPSQHTSGPNLASRDNVAHTESIYDSGNAATGLIPALSGADYAIGWVKFEARRSQVHVRFTLSRRQPVLGSHRDDQFSISFGHRIVQWSPPRMRNAQPSATVRVLHCLLISSTSARRKMSARRVRCTAYRTSLSADRAVVSRRAAEPHRRAADTPA